MAVEMQIICSLWLSEQLGRTQHAALTLTFKVCRVVHFNDVPFKVECAGFHS